MRQRPIRKLGLARTAWWVSITLACSGQEVVLGEFERTPAPSGGSAATGGNMTATGGAAGVGGLGGSATGTGAAIGSGGSATGGSAGAPPQAPCTGALEFPDPEFELLVRARTGIAQGPIPAIAVAEVQEIHSTSITLRSIEGAQCLNKLQLMTLAASVDLSPLWELTQLSTLAVPIGTQQHFDSVAGLGSVVELYVQLDPSYDLNALDALDRLRTLLLTFETAGETSPEPELDVVTRMLSLTALRVIRSGADTLQLSNVGFLRDAPQLEQLDIIGTTLADLGPIAELSGLRGLRLEDNRIVDLTPLAFAGAVSELVLSKNGISELSPLAGSTALESLVADDNFISDVSVLSGLPELATLSLQGNAISDLTPLAALAGLQEVRLNRNQITDLSPLAQSESFLPEVLEIQDNPIDCSAQAANVELLAARITTLRHDCFSANP